MSKITFSAMPSIVNYQRPDPTVLVQIASAIQARGCYIITTGRFAVSAEVANDVFVQLQKDKGTHDLALINILEVAPPPVYFGDIGL